MKNLVLVVLLSVISFVAQAQSSEGHLTGGEDEVSQRAISSFSPTPEIQGFRVCIFSGSEQDARTKAKQNLEMCYSVFADIDGEIVYEAPIFKVLVGACVNRIEAIQLLSKLKGSFPKAFIISCNIPIEDFVSSDENQNPSDSLSVN